MLKRKEGLEGQRVKAVTIRSLQDDTCYSAQYAAHTTVKLMLDVPRSPSDLLVLELLHPGSCYRFI